MDLKGMMLSLKSQPQKHTLIIKLYDIAKWQNYTDGKQLSDCQELGRERTIKGIVAGEKS